MKACDIDDLLCMPARMAIMVSLFSCKEMTFTELSEATGLADGNLYVQARKLLAGGCVDKEKAPRGRRVVTLFRITEIGRSRLVAHLNMVWRDLGGKTTRKAYRPGVKGRKSNEDDSRFW